MIILKTDKIKKVKNVQTELFLSKITHIQITLHINYLPYILNQ